MAALFLSSACQSGNERFSCVKDEKMEKLLTDIKDNNREVRKKEIIAGFTKATLLEFRRKLFEAAVKKAEKKMEDDDGPWDEIPDTTINAEQRPSSWGLRNRKTKPSVADDAIDLALYVDGSAGTFPMQIVRSPNGKEKSDQASNAAELDNGDSSSDSSVFEETEETPKTQKSPEKQAKDKSNENNNGKSNNPTTPTVERFVIRESRDEGNQCDIAVTLTPLKDNGTSTEDLYEVRSFSTQTERVMFQELDEADSSGSSFNEDLVESTRNKTLNTMQKTQIDDSVVWKLRERCDRAESRLIELERRHQYEISEMKQEHVTIRNELAALASEEPREGREEVVSQRTATYNTCIDLTDRSNMIWTQDSQGASVLTKESEMHRDLAQSDRATRTNS